MAGFDWTPVMRSSIGFDRVSRLLDAALRGDAPAAPTWPPYDIEKLGDDTYRLVLAAPGLKIDDIEIIAEPNQLTVKGKARERAGVQAWRRAIPAGPFEHRFQLADHLRAAGASLVDGLLTVELVRVVPEALKPRRVAISAAAPSAPALTAEAA